MPTLLALACVAVTLQLAAPPEPRGQLRPQQVGHAVQAPVQGADSRVGSSAGSSSGSSAGSSSGSSAGSSSGSSAGSSSGSSAGSSSGSNAGSSSGSNAGISAGSDAGSSIDSATGAGPAACVIGSAHQVLMVRDIWSRRWSLPGGEGQAGETQRQTAQRTTQQQIGLDVRVGRYLGAAARGVGLFVCEPPEHSLPLSGNLLLLPAAARMATLEAQLLDAPSLPRSAWRYASQAAPTVAVLQNLPQALPLRLVPSTEPGNRLFAAELQGIRWLQSLGTPPVHHAMRMASYLGSERAMLFVAAALWALRGRFRGAEVIFVLSTACLLGCLAKQACALPRPCYLDAALQLDPASSFGFPSGHTVVATTLAALFAWRTPRPLLWGCAAAVALCTGLARTYLGVHFFHDVLGGWCLAAAGLGLHAVAVRRYADRFVPVRLWALLGAGLSVVALALQPQPTPIVFSSLLLGLCTGLTVFTLLPLQPRAAVVQLLLFAAGIYLSDAITHLLRPAEATTALCALHLAARFFFLGLLLPLTHACCQALQRLSQRSGETAAL